MTLNAGLADRFRMVVIDLRGYNRSDKPSGVDQYAMPLLVSDIVAVIRQLAVEINISPKAAIVGHALEWGRHIVGCYDAFRSGLSDW